MPNTITQDVVRHIALLGRLRLTDAEVAEFTEELAAILDYIDQLRGVDVEGVEPTAHAVAVQNVFRADTVRSSLPPDVAVANAPQHHETFFKVPKVLDQDTV